MHRFANDTNQALTRLSHAAMQKVPSLTIKVNRYINVLGHLTGSVTSQLGSVPNNCDHK